MSAFSWRANCPPNSQLSFTWAGTELIDKYKPILVYL